MEKQKQMPLDELIEMLDDLCHPPRWFYGPKRKEYDLYVDWVTEDPHWYWELENRLRICLTLVNCWLVRHSGLKLMPGGYQNFNWQGDPKCTTLQNKRGTVWKDPLPEYSGPRPRQADYHVAVSWVGDKATYWLNLLGIPPAEPAPNDKLIPSWFGPLSFLFDAEVSLFLTWRGYEVGPDREGRWPFPAAPISTNSWRAMILAVMRLEGGRDDLDDLRLW